MRFLISFMAILWLSAPATAQTVAQEQVLRQDMGQLAEWLEGTYSNGSQTLAGSNHLHEALIDPERAPDLIYARFHRIDAPEVGDTVFYLQWHMRTPFGDLQRQRIWSFRTDLERNAVTMDFYTLKEPDRWLNLFERPATAATLSLDDMTGYPPGCPLPFRRHIDVFIGEIPPECQIPSRTRGGMMQLMARVMIGEEQVWYDEGATHLESGDVVFDVPASGAYQFKRVALPPS